MEAEKRRNKIDAVQFFVFYGDSRQAVYIKSFDRFVRIFWRCCINSLCSPFSKNTSTFVSWSALNVHEWIMLHNSHEHVSIISSPCISKFVLQWPLSAHAQTATVNWLIIWQTKSNQERRKKKHNGVGIYFELLNSPSYPWFIPFILICCIYVNTKQTSFTFICKNKFNRKKWERKMRMELGSTSTCANF